MCVYILYLSRYVPIKIAGFSPHQSFHCVLLISWVHIPVVSQSNHHIHAIRGSSSAEKWI